MQSHHTLFRFSLLRAWGSPTIPAKNLLIPQYLTKFLSPYQTLITPPPLNKNLKIFILQPNKNFIFSGSHCSCTIFVSISYPLHTQVILILILSVGVHKKGSKFQNNSSLGSHHLQKKSSQAELLIPTPPPPPPHTGEGISLHPLMLFWKTLLFG